MVTNKAKSEIEIPPPLYILYLLFIYLFCGVFLSKIAQKFYNNSMSRLSHSAFRHSSRHTQSLPALMRKRISNSQLGNLIEG